MSGAAEAVGTVVGWALAPITAAVSRARRARTFHPDGRVFQVRVEPCDGPLADVGRRLAGPGLARFSSAWWRGSKEWTDALGLALRLLSSDLPTSAPAPGDQDLLFATIRSPWTTLLAPLTTDVHDYLTNDYYAVSPFSIDGRDGLYTLRVVTPHVAGVGTRDARLSRAVEEGRASLSLEARPRGGAWAPLATVRVVEEIPIDQAALRFSPFANGRGLTPRGFVHALRHGAYAASQRARPRLSV